MRHPEKAEILDRMGANIVRFRERRGWTRADLATLLGVTTRRLAGWEEGKHEMHLKYFVAVGELLEVSLDDLLEMTAEDPLPELPWSQHPN
ncbi:MAG: helix-turn-helix domain-containing protein [Thermoanaerobaculia bacterium]